MTINPSDFVGKRLKPVMDAGDLILGFDPDTNDGVFVTSGMPGASTISVLDTAGNYTATNVESVLAEQGQRFVSMFDVADPQFLGMPKLMATPPTVAVANNTAPSTTVGTPFTLPGLSYTSILPEDTTKFRPLGLGVRTFDRGGAPPQSFAVGWGTGIGAGVPQAFAAEWLFDGTVCEVILRQFTGTQFRIMVDGEYVTQYPVSLGGTSNSYGQVKMTFASRAVRRIRFELVCTGNAWFGIAHQINDTIIATAAPSRRLVWCGDSYSGGSSSSAIGSCGTYAAHALGFRDVVNSSVGGSGWSGLAARRLTDIINQAPTDLVIALGHNDTAGAALTTAVTDNLTAIRAALPNLRSLFVVGPIWAGGETAAAYTVRNDQIEAGCAGGLATFIDTIDVPIFTGTGRVGATTGTGNSDLYIAADGVHPTDAGSVWLGYSLAERIMAAA
jgi:lysophospholipase L1-like esterase